MGRPLFVSDVPGEHTVLCAVLAGIAHTRNGTKSYPTVHPVHPRWTPQLLLLYRRWTQLRIPQTRRTQRVGQPLLPHPLPLQLSSRTTPWPRTASGRPLRVWTLLSSGYESYAVPWLPINKRWLRTTTRVLVPNPAPISVRHIQRLSSPTTRAKIPPRPSTPTLPYTSPPRLCSGRR